MILISEVVTAQIIFIIYKVGHVAAAGKFEIRPCRGRSRK